MLLPPWAHELNPDEITIIVILGYVSAMEGWRTIAGLASTISKNQYIFKMFWKLKNKAGSSFSISFFGFSGKLLPLPLTCRIPQSQQLLPSWVTSLMGSRFRVPGLGLFHFMPTEVWTLQLFAGIPTLQCRMAQSLHQTTQGIKTLHLD